MQLPRPVEQLPQAGDNNEIMPQGQPEQGRDAAAELAPTAPPAQPPIMPTTNPLQPVQAQAFLQDDVSTSTNSARSTLADDKDLIEKEWVNRAKAIVDRTRDDPYTQSEELTVVKADYMKQRYNKTLKLNK